MMIDVELCQAGEMAPGLLTTKLYIPPVRTELVPQPELLERLNADLTDCAAEQGVALTPRGSDSEGSRAGNRVRDDIDGVAKRESGCDSPIPALRLLPRGRRDPGPESDLVPWLAGRECGPVRTGLVSFPWARHPRGRRKGLAFTLPDGTPASANLQCKAREICAGRQSLRPIPSSWTPS
jgi:hypothetical protein